MDFSGVDEDVAVFDDGFARVDAEVSEEGGWGGGGHGCNLLWVLGVGVRVRC